MMTLIVVWMFGGLLGYAAAQKRGYSPFAGVVGGVLLGPLAFLLFFVSGVTRGDASRKCPRCAEWVKADAIVCKHCGGELTPPSKTPPPAPSRRGGSEPLTTVLTWLVVVLGLVAAGLMLGLF